MKPTSIALVIVSVMAATLWVDSLLPIPNPFYQAAQAAAPTPISENCEQVATVGLLDVFFCESEHGDFYVNSFGFMMTEY